MAKFTPYALEELPANGIDVNGMYFIKKANESTFKIFLRKNNNSDWVALGLTDAVNTVNNLTGNVKIDLSFSDGKLEITATGDGSAATVASIDLDDHYRQVGDIPWSEVGVSGDDVPDFALDDEVVHKTGDETVAGRKTFTTVPRTNADPKDDNDLTRKKYVDDQIAGLEQVVQSSIDYKGDIDASTDPDFPAADKGDMYIIKRPGKIGGSSGMQVDVGNMLICKEDRVPSGTLSAVGYNWTVLQADLDQATEVKKGFARIATGSEMDALLDDSTIVTPLKLSYWWRVNGLEEVDSDFVSYGNQTPTSGQRAIARDNIGAAADDEVVHKTGAETVAGKKTFTTLPEANITPTGNNQLTRKKYVDDQVAEAVKWGDKVW